MRGRRVGADEALSLGLVTEVVPDAELDDAVAWLVEELSRHSPLALAMAKRVLEHAPTTARSTWGSSSKVSPTASSARRAISARASRRSARSGKPEFTGE